MTYDEVIPLLGDFGRYGHNLSNYHNLPQFLTFFRYQKRIYFLLCLPAILCAFHKLGNVFLVAKADYR